MLFGREQIEQLRADMAFKDGEIARLTEEASKLREDNMRKSQSIQGYRDLVEQSQAALLQEAEAKARKIQQLQADRDLAAALAAQQDEQLAMVKELAEQLAALTNPTRLVASQDWLAEFSAQAKADPAEQPVTQSAEAVSAWVAAE